MLGRDGIEHAFVDIACDETTELVAVHQGVADETVDDAGITHQGRGEAARIEVLQRGIVLRPRNAKGAIKAPVLTPDTMVKLGR